MVSVLLKKVSEELSAMGYFVLWASLKDVDKQGPEEDSGLCLHTQHPYYKYRHSYFRRAMAILLDRQRLPVRAQFGQDIRMMQDQRLSMAQLAPGESFFFLAFHPEQKTMYHYLRFRLNGERPVDALLADLLDVCVYEWTK